MRKRNRVVRNSQVIQMTHMPSLTLEEINALAKQVAEDVHKANMERAAAHARRTAAIAFAYLRVDEAERKRAEKS